MKERSGGRDQNDRGCSETLSGIAAVEAVAGTVVGSRSEADQRCNVEMCRNYYKFDTFADSPTPFYSSAARG